jgi:hypothetical protein
VKIYRKLIVDIETGETIFENSYELPKGAPIEKACGPSSQQESLAGSATSLSSEISSAFNQNFADQSATLKSISSALSPIAAAGPSQQGFSAAELAARNTAAINNSGAAARNATQSIQGHLAGRGGDSGLESGVDQQIVGSVKSNAANQLAGAEDNITAENYGTGRENYWRAQGGMQALANSYDPNGFAGSAVSAGNAAFGDATKIQDMKNQEQAAIAGGITSLATDALTFGAGGMAGMAGSAAGASQPGAFFSGGMSALAGNG